MARRRKIILIDGKMIPTEYEECVAFWDRAELHPLLSKYLVKHVNEGKRTKFAGYKLKRIGMIAGLPDYQLFMRNIKYIGLLLEIKRQDQRNIAKPPTQLRMISLLQETGHYACFAYGADHAWQVCMDYLDNKL